jgi:hypothetical protein
LVPPLRSTRGVQQSCTSSQRCSTPTDIARFTFGTTPWCSKSVSTGSVRPPPSAVRKETLSTLPAPSARSSVTPGTTGTFPRTDITIFMPLRK